MDKFLLSLVYAIKELETPLTSEKKNQLKDASEQLVEDSTAWEMYTKPMLKEIISNNSSLNKVFQNIQSNLEKIGDIPQDFIPSTEGSVTVTPRKNLVQERPIPNLSPGSLKSNEITNMCIQIISSPEPSETVQKISKFEQLRNFISQNNSDNK